MVGVTSYIESRLARLKALQLFQLDEERDLTAFEDGLITTNVAHAYLE